MLIGEVILFCNLLHLNIVEQIFKIQYNLCISSERIIEHDSYLPGKLITIDYGNCIELCKHTMHDL